MELLGGGSHDRADGAAAADDGGGSHGNVDEAAGAPDVAEGVDRFEAPSTGVGSPLVSRLRFFFFGLSLASSATLALSTSCGRSGAGKALKPVNARETIIQQHHCVAHSNNAIPREIDGAEGFNGAADSPRLEDCGGGSEANPAGRATEVDGG